ncbi:MAG: hypothetical protein MI864_08910 [Pseudomonadales bacterium]|nr:hypothetical protein [Pseudomonadales bacterium]
MARFHHNLIAVMFSYIFIALAFILVAQAVLQFSQDWFSSQDSITTIIKTINTMVIALAMYELGMGIGEEYTQNRVRFNIFALIQRTITRFVSVVCIALVLEGLIMVIKYSQLEMAGNLWYPVGIIAASGLLLVSLGAFLKLSSGVCIAANTETAHMEEHPHQVQADNSAQIITDIICPDSSVGSMSRVTSR